MRITGGRARGIQLLVPKGEKTRPATDRMRESVFSSIGPDITGCRIADLFAGTGAYGLEAFSRGAEQVAFFENDRNALKCLKENTLRVSRSCELNVARITNIYAGDLFTSNPASPVFDYIFADPPYESTGSGLAKIFEFITDRLNGAHSTVVFEIPGNLHPEVPNWSVIKRLGKSGRDRPTVAFFKHLAGGC